MKTNSIQFKFLITVISAMIAIAIFVGGLSIYEVDDFVKKQTESFVQSSCQNEALKLNSSFEDMEKSVQIMDRYTRELISGVEDITNVGKKNEILSKVTDMFGATALDSEGGVAYYLRFNPEISDSTSGIFYSKVNGGQNYVRFEPTDISIYDRDDVEHVGWFWLPYDAGQPVWLDPYYNQNNAVLMISYVIPMYLEDTFIGVVGMDFDFEYIMNRVHQIKIYENGYAHIEINGRNIHLTDSEHADEYAEKEASDKYLRVSEDLINGMDIVLSASFKDLRQIRYEIGLKILAVVVLLVALFSVLIILFVKKMIVPISKLAEASKSLANGDYSVEIAHSNTYELELLSTAFENMIVQLREHEKLQHILAYRDSLTGLRNTTSYKSWVDDFNKVIKAESPTFGVAVFDINYLKEANDKYGHDVGNKLIIAVARIIADTFKRSPVFRIGGDEFLAILQNKDLEAHERLFEQLARACEENHVGSDLKNNVTVSVAVGYSEYNPETDTEFVDVFNRADNNMYKNKREMKKLHSLNT